MADYNNSGRIIKKHLGDRLIEFTDKLSLARVETASEKHSEYSKVNVLIQNKGQNGNIIADVNLDPRNVKRLYTKYCTEKSQESYLEQKVLAHRKNDEGKVRVTKFNISFDDTRRYKWSILIENGWGKPRLTGNLTNIEPGTYAVAKKVIMFLNDNDFTDCIRDVYDHLMNFENYAYSVLRPLRDEYERKFREEYKKAQETA